MNIDDFSLSSLSDSQAGSVAAKIDFLFEQWNSQRSSQLKDYEFIRSTLYNNTEKQSGDWRSDVMLPDLYELASTFKAHVWEDLFASIDTMFDVTGKTPSAKEYAPLQKAALINSFRNMNIFDVLETALNSLTEAGEAILFVGWNTVYKQIRRQNSLSESGFSIENKVMYDGASVKAISPEDFVFDTSLKSSWDACPKIFRSLMTADELLSCPAFSINKAVKSYIDESISTIPPTNSITPNDTGSEHLFTVLEYWGNFSLEDGTLLKNMLITVIDGAFVVRCEQNPFIINPFVYATLVESPEHKRGISPLQVAVSLNKLSSTILNSQVDALSLITNPPYLAPKGAFNGAQEVSPGKIIEYDSSLLPQLPTPLSFNAALQGWEFINFFKQSIESSTGLFKNMVGEKTDEMRTATEVNHTVSGQSIRLNFAIDTIFRKLVIPMVSAVADLLANFSYGVEEIPVILKGKTTFVQVFDDIRQADYSYIYGDKHSASQKKLQFNEFFNIISNFAKIPDVSQSINWLECFKYALEQYGIENSSAYIRE